MTSWFAGVPPDDGPSEMEPKEEGKEDNVKSVATESQGDENKPTAKAPESQENQPKEEENPENPQIDLDEMAEKTIHAAKEWGSELKFSELHFVKAVKTIN